MLWILNIIGMPHHYAYINNIGTFCCFWFIILLLPLCLCVCVGGGGGLCVMLWFDMCTMIVSFPGNIHLILWITKATKCRKMAPWSYFSCKGTLFLIKKYFRFFL